jgi:hypothetical protein
MRNKIAILFICFISSYLLGINFASSSELKSFEQLASESLESLQNAHPNVTPQFDHPERASQEQYLSNVPAGALAYEGSKLHSDTAHANPDGIHAAIEEASSPKHVADKLNYDQLELFKRSDTIMQDAEQQENDTGKACSAPQHKKYAYIRQASTIQDPVLETKSCESPIANFSCEKALKLQCKQVINCAIKGSVSTHMTFHHENNVLTFGEMGKDYWRHNVCGLFEGSATFTLHHLSSLEEFQLIEVGFDDHMQILLNDQTVYVGPSGGTKIEIQGRSVYNGHSHSPCELNTDWHQYPNIDLRPYLQEGLNKLHIRVAVAGAGEGWVKIRTKQKCCEWEESWETHCEHRQ